MAIVVIVTEVAGTPEEAEDLTRVAYDHYETPHYIYAAESLDQLPHPSQRDEIQAAFGDQISN